VVIRGRSERPAQPASTTRVSAPMATRRGAMTADTSPGPG
jgi:hypothetical protein